MSLQTLAFALPDHDDQSVVMYLKPGNEAAGHYIHGQSARQLTKLGGELLLYTLSFGRDARNLQHLHHMSTHLHGPVPVICWFTTMPVAQLDDPYSFRNR